MPKTILAYNGDTKISSLNSSDIRTSIEDSFSELRNDTEESLKDLEKSLKRYVKRQKWRRHRWK